MTTKGLTLAAAFVALVFAWLLAPYHERALRPVPSPSEAAASASEAPFVLDAAPPADPAPVESSEPEPEDAADYACVPD